MDDLIKALKAQVPSINLGCRYVALFRYGFVEQKDEQAMASAICKASSPALEGVGLDVKVLTLPIVHCLHSATHPELYLSIANSTEPLVCSASVCCR